MLAPIADRDDAYEIRTCVAHSKTRRVPSATTTLPAMKNRIVVVALGLFCAPLIGPAVSRAAPKPQCDRLSDSIKKPKKFVPRRYVTRLERTAAKEPKCLAAPNAAYARLSEQWRRVIPEIKRPASRRVVMKTLSRYRASVAYLKALMRFPRFAERPQAMLMLARLHDAMATYIEQAGNGPRTVFMVKEPGALYHDRAVDIRELLMLEAERTYAFVSRLLINASKLNPTKIQAREGLSAIRARLEARKVVLPPPAPDEDELVPLP